MIRCPCPRAARVQPRGCKGRSPLHKKNKNLPLPHGGRALCERGSGGWGKNLVIWLVTPATKNAAPPIGDSDGRVIRQRRGKPPRRRVIRRPCSGAARVQPRGCKGRSPLHKKAKKLPLPRRGRGLGGWGKEIHDVAGSAGDPNRRSPPSGIATAGLSGNAGASPPSAHDTLPLPPRRPGSAPGMQGAKPLA